MKGDVIDYCEVWSIYKNHPHYQENILAELDLDSWLPNASVNIQVYVLDNCPEEIIKALPYIKSGVLERLGLSKRAIRNKIYC